MRYLKHLTTYFIPGKHNQYKPHFFRAEAVLATAGVIALLFLAAISFNSLVIRSGSSQLGAVVSSVLVELANTDRAANKLEGLTISAVLQQAAQMKADDMAAKGYFAHNSPEGLTPWHWFKEAGYSFSFAGENLAVYFSDSAELERAWMNSPLHRANILGSSFTEIGIATAKGMYQGRETVYVVQEFGRPSRRLASASVKNTEVAPVENVSVSQAANKLAPQETKLAENTISETAVFAAISAPALLKVAASPRTFLRTAYSVLAWFIVFALVLMIGIEVKRQHPLHIAYGVSLLVLMSALFFSWQGFFFGKLLVL